MKTLVWLLAILCCSNLAWPCANFHSSATKLSGESTRATITADRELRNAIRRNPQDEGRTIEAKLRGSTKFEDRSDYAVALMYLGRSSEAVELLQALEREEPGDYAVAANLGTALELSGDNAGALQWIREGIRRNPKSHQGTEWLHAKILESKIVQARDPDHFGNHSVLELAPDTSGKTVSIDGVERSRETVRKALRYQLMERMQFVKPPDPVVAGLLLDYAAVEAADRTLESARKLLSLSMEYGVPQARIQPLLDRYDRRIAARRYKEFTFKVAAAAAVLGLIFGLLYRLHKSGHFVISSTSGRAH
jgi:tetratricopeptide (TPR) repeat protein